MKRLFQRRALAVVLLGLLLLIPALLFLVRMPFLAVEEPGGRSALYLPLYGVKEFSIQYVHSVHKTPVWENFSPGPGDSIVLTSTSFDSFGVGIPFLPGEGKLENRQGRFYLTGLKRSFPEISLGVSPVAGQTLIFRDKKYNLDSYFDPGSLIRFRIVRRSPGWVLWRQSKSWGGTD